MDRLVVIGDPVEESLSPIIHNAALRDMGLDDRYNYTKKRVQKEMLKFFIDDIREGKFAGANVTIPHKRNVIAYMDELSESAKAIGAVNTIYKRDQKLIGDNTDSIGFIRSLEDEGVHVKGGCAMVLGAGGAARAVVYALGKKGMKSIILANRSIDSAVEVKDEMRACINTEISVITVRGVKDKLEDADIVVNTTPVGMKGKLEDRSVIPGEWLSPPSTVVDIVYIPPKTKLLRDAEKRGCKTISGLGMLVHQGAVALENWTGKEVLAKVMKDALLECLEEKDAT